MVPAMVTRSEAAREIVRLLPSVAISLRLGTLFGLEAVDLTANQMLALLVICSAPDGRMKAGEIAGRLGISLPAATALVDRLVSAGIVARSQGEDRRVVWVSATEAGQGLLDRLTGGLEKAVDAAIEQDNNPATLDALVEGMRRVASFADRIGEPHAEHGSARQPTGSDSQPPP
jgi:DNA-binding MarR family transcriptional regulator